LDSLQPLAIALQHDASHISDATLRAAS